MREIIAEGSSVEDAVQNALRRMGVQRNQVEVEVLEEGSRGFLGLIGGRTAKVRVQKRVTPEEVIRGFIEDVIKSMDLNVEYKICFDDGYWRVELSGDDIKFLIGRRGETLNALQLLVNLAVNKRLGEKVRILLDAEGYRERREEALRKLARRIADRVRRTKKDITLEPMPPQERRIIHLELQNKKGIFTISQGREPYRRIAICYKNSDYKDESKE